MTNETAGSPEWIDPDDAPVLTEAEAGEVERFKGDTFIRRGRGRPKIGNAKELVSLRLDPEILERLRSAGPGWQTQVNLLLRQALGLRAEPGSLHSETFSLERHPVTDGRPVTGSFSEGTIEMTETAEEAGLSKSLHVTEEVGLCEEVTDRVAAGRDTVREGKADFEQDIHGDTEAGEYSR